MVFKLNFFLALAAVIIRPCPGKIIFNPIQLYWTDNLPSLHFWTGLLFPTPTRCSIHCTWPAWPACLQLTVGHVWIWRAFLIVFIGIVRFLQIPPRRSVPMKGLYWVSSVQDPRPVGHGCHGHSIVLSISSCFLLAVLHQWRALHWHRTSWHLQETT